MRNKVFIVEVFCSVLCMSAQYQDSTSYSLDSLSISPQSIFGTEKKLNEQSGSAYYISPQEIQKYSYTDMSDIVSQVPGVIFTEEDGYGLRPNIGFRGSSPERSAGISLMEDGVLISPAPYTSPSAYYFPTAGRMYGVEVLKGSSQIKYGPNTTSGVLNMISTPVKHRSQFHFNGFLGTNNTYQSHAYAGTSVGNFAVLGEFFAYGSDGFKSLPDNAPTGFDKQDYLAKVRYTFPTKSSWKQDLQLKLQYSKERSFETYLGLTDFDFANDPFQRYSASRNDVMNANHDQIQLTYTLQHKNTDIVVDLYNNHFKRNWYKIQSVDAGAGKKSLDAVLNNPDTFADELAVLKGSFVGDNSVYLRNNNRDYDARGIQLKGHQYFNQNEIKHTLAYGARYHYDNEDRFQWENSYQSVNQNLILQEVGEGGSQSNQLSEAKALSAYAEWFTHWNKFIFSAGVRYEDIQLVREDYGTNDPNRTGSELSTRENDVSIFLPGASILYKHNEAMEFFAGAFKGFSTPGTTPNQDPEESWNYELGWRYHHNRVSQNITLFYNDYSNLLGSDSNASGGAGNNELYNAGEVGVYGVEFSGNYEFLPAETSHQLRALWSYTFTHTELQSNFDSEVWGEVQKGDAIPYIPAHTFQGQLQYSSNSVDVGITSIYRSEVRVLPGQGSIPASEKVKGYLVFNAFAQYHLQNNLRIVGRVENLFNNEYAVSRNPAGLRPGLPITFSLGLQAAF